MRTAERFTSSAMMAPASTWHTWTSCSALSSVSMQQPSSPGPGLASPQYDELSIVMEAAPGPKERWARGRLSRLPFRNMAEANRMHDKQVILLVEDNPDDEALTLRALKKNNITTKVIVAHDGVEAIDYVFGTGLYEGRDPHDLPRIILLDLKLPRVDGFEVLTRLRTDERTKLLPIIILTSSKEQQDIVHGYRLGANSYVRKPVDF